MKRRTQSAVPATSVSAAARPENVCSTHRRGAAIVPGLRVTNAAYPALQHAQPSAPSAVVLPSSSMPNPNWPIAPAACHGAEYSSIGRTTKSSSHVAAARNAGEARTTTAEPETARARTRSPAIEATTEPQAIQNKAAWALSAPSARTETAPATDTAMSVHPAPSVRRLRMTPSGNGCTVRAR